MSRIFLSHASEDKALVRRIASDLLAEGFPVWFDEWNMETGDSLVDEIYGGIEGSRFVILCVSEHSRKSEWVNKELNAALSQEDRTGEKMLIPIKLDGSETPLKVADRIYASFSKSYHQPFETLVGVLKKYRLEPDEEAANFRLALTFLRDIDLNSTQFEAQLAVARSRYPGFELSPDQLVVVEGERGRALRAKAFARLDQLDKDPYYSPKFATEFQQRIAEIRKLDRYLAEAVCFVLNEFYFRRENLLVRPIVAVTWICRALRAAQLGSLRHLQNPDDPGKIEAEPVWKPYLSMSEQDLYGVAELGRLAVGPSSDGLNIWESTGIWIDVEDPLYRDTWYQGHPIVVALRDYSSQAISQYVLPQLVISRLRDNESTLLPIPLEELFAGRS